MAPEYKDDWLRRIKIVEREFLASRLALDRFLQAPDRDAATFGTGIKVRDIRQASKRLEGTYLIRLFAEFEAGLRQYWRSVKKGKEPPSRTRDLLDSVGAMRTISNELVVNAHAVRDYRNALVHDRADDEAAAVSLLDARGYLCKFFSFLPRQW